MIQKNQNTVIRHVSRVHYYFNFYFKKVKKKIIKERSAPFNLKIQSDDLILSFYMCAFYEHLRYIRVCVIYKRLQDSLNDSCNAQKIAFE
jgi:hypothetical protein